MLKLLRNNRVSYAKANAPDRTSLQLAGRETDRWRLPIKGMLLTVALLIGLLQAQAQTFQIGSGTATTNFFPIRAYYGYNYSQQIYTLSELNTAGMAGASTITKIRFYSANPVTPFANWNNWTIYLGNTSQSTFATTSSWIPVANLTQVYSGSFTPVANTWIEFTLATPFMWDGTSNIVVAVDENIPNYSDNETSWRAYTGGANTGILYYNDGTNPNPSSPPTANYRSDIKAQVQFEVVAANACSGTPAPGNTTASANPVCSGVSFTLGLQNATTGSGVSYQWQSADNASFTSGVTNLGTSSTQSTSQTSAKYYRAIVTCAGNGTTASTPVYVTMQNFLNCYCASSATNAGDEEIYSVTVNGVTNASNCSTVAPGPGSILDRYSNFTTLGPLTSVMQGALVSYSIAENECNGATYYAFGTGIWIDYNQDGDFTDPDEQILVEPGTTIGPRNISGTFTVPMTALSGTTQMRVTVAEGFSGTSLTPCLSYGYGETEDYLITISAAQVCSTPDGGTATASATSLCGSGGITISNSGFSFGVGTTYDWEYSTNNFATAGISTGQTNPASFSTGTINTTTSYRLRTTCSSTNSTDYSNVITVTVNPNPVVGLSASATSYCSPSTSSISLTASGASTYTWTPSSGLSATTGAAVQASPSASTTYTVTGTDANGCQDTETVTISVSSAPVVEATATPAAICSGASTQLSATTSCPTGIKITEIAQFGNGGTGQTPTYPSYMNSPDDLVEISNLASTAFDAGGMVLDMYTGTTLLRSYTIPTGTVIPANGVLVLAIRAGTDSPANLFFNTGTPDNPNSSGTAVGYVLRKTGGIVDVVATNGYVFPAVSGVTSSDWSVNLASSSGRAGIIRTATTDNNVATDWTISNTPTPVQSIGTYNAGYTTVENVCSGYTYAWSPFTGLNSASIPNPVASNLTSTTTYSVMVTGPTGCSTLDAVTVTVGNPLTVSASVGTTPVCEGTNLMLSGSTTGGGAPFTYTWTGPNGFSSNDLSPVVTGTTTASSGTYTLTVNDACGNNVQATVAATVNEMPVASISGNPSGCYGTVTLTANSSVPGSSLQWYLNDNPIGGAGSTNYTPAQNGSYTVEATTSNGCTSMSSAVSVTLLPVPTGLTASASVSAVCPSGASNLSAAASLAVSGTIGNGTTANSSTSYPTPFGQYYEGVRTQFLILASELQAAGYQAGTIEKIGWDVTATNGAGVHRDYTLFLKNTSASALTATFQTGMTQVTAPVNYTPVSGLNEFTLGTPNTFVWDGVSNIVVEATFNSNLSGTTVEYTTNASVNYTTTSFASVTYFNTDNSTTVATTTTGTTSTNRANIELTITPAPNYNWTLVSGDGLPATTNTAAITVNPTVTSTYMVTASNPANASCAATNTVTITVNPVPSVSIAPTNVSCNSGSNGAATATVSSGTSPFTYAWSPSGGTAATASGLSAGTYTVTVTDANGCMDTESVTITQPAVLTASIASPTNVSCNGGANGSATASATGGTGAMSYAWSNGATTATATGLMAGTYTVTVTDANGCTDTESVTITQPASAVSGTTVVTNVACFGGSNGAINLTPAGGTAPYTYNWGGGVTTEDRTGLVAGTYTVVITDANGCTGTVTASITQPSAPVSGTTVVTNVACFGGSTGAINLTPTGGTGPYTYNWLPSGPTTEDRTGLVAGTYTVVITDANGCTGTVTTSVTQPSAPVSGTTVVTNVACNGGSTGAINLTATGGTGPYTYNWGSGVTTEDRTGLTAGTYTVIVTDANGCTGTVTTSVTQPAAPVSGTTVVTNVACNGGSTGAINLTPAGGTGPYTYNWGGGVTTEDRTGLSAGTYTVVITDANGCTGTVTTSVTQPASAVSGTTVVTNVACFGGSNGAINLTPAGGTAPYTYNWGGGVTTEDRTGLVAGTYTVVITDANGCTGTVTASITQPSAPVSGTTVVTNVACFGGSTGAINLTPTGGTGPYTYNWLPSGPTTQDRTGLVAGTYTVVITDANGCTGTVTASVTQPSAPVSGTTVVTNVACNGGSSGAINLTAAGGTAPYTYNWGGGVTTEDRTGLTAGTYTVIVTDANGCTGTVTASVTQPAALVASIASSTNVSCNGGSNGSATASATGGTGAMTYAWSNGATTATATGLMAGTYTVTVTDANGCTDTESVTISAPSAVVASVTSTNVTTAGGSNGTATASASGGTGAYTYSWSNGATTASITGLSAGTYTVTVTDANGCTDTESVTITSPSCAMTAAISASSNVSCNGGSNGSATVSLTSGTAPYTYAWSNGQTTATATGLMAGSYTVTVTDANGCTAAATATITQPAAALAATATAGSVSCNGGANGIASVTATGGTGAYTYLWSNGATTDVVTGLSAGTYTVTVTDANGCTDTETVTITQPAAVVASITSSTNATCNGATNGAATVAATGGTGTMSYLWSNGDTTATVTGLMAGTYTVTVTDDNGCQDTESVTITQPAAVVASIASSTNVSCNGGANGSATASATGGTGAMTYAWSNGATTATATGLMAGTYTVTVTDANGCTDTESVTISAPSAVVASVTSTNVTTAGGSNGTATASASGGTGAYTYSWSNGATTASITGLSAGTYTVTVTDANGCTDTESVTITSPSCAMTAAISASSNVSCNGGSNGSATVSLTSGTAPYTYAWSNGQTTATATGLMAGSYTVTVTDANGCTAAATATITQPAALVASISGSANVSCNGGSNGTATVGVSGGTGAMTYAWSNGQTTLTATGLMAGTYTVTVTDANGCTDTESVTITQPAAVVASIASSSNVSCNGGSNGSATATATGGTGAMTYAWSNGQTTATATGLMAGTYTVTVTDANGCTDTESVTITAPSAVVASIASSTNVSCNGGSNGSATASASGGTGAITYSWSNGQTTATATGLMAGTYTVTVTDANGCTDTESVTITQPAAVVASIASSSNVSCNGGSNGSATATATGGTGAMTYAWSNGQTTATATGLMAGTYTVTVTDANGCTDTESVTITAPSAVVASIASSTNVSCNGGSNGSATASASGGTGAITYSWSNGQTTATATGLMAGTYTVTVTDANGCTDTETVTITQPAAVVVSASADQGVCPGGSATLTASGADSYVWMPGNMTGSTITVTPSATTTYTVTGTVNGCSSMAMTTVTVNPAPVATASSNSPVNFNATIMLSATGGSSYSWSGPNGFTSTAQNPQIQNATNANAGVYNVTVTSAQGCTATASTTVTIGTANFFTINQTQPASATNFTSFGAAASYLNTTGVSSQVIIDVVAGTGPYVNQQMLLGQIPGSSASNTVTINGNGNTISLCSGDPLNRDIIRLDGTDNLILNGLVISAGCGNGWGIHMMNGNENVTLSNNTINLNAANSIYGANMQGIIAANSNTATGAMAGVLNDVTITGNTINNGYNGIRINGNSATWANNLTISGNTLNSTVYFGIITSYTNNLTVNGNMVSMKNVAQNQDIHSIGIQLSYVESGLSVRANRVINAGKQALFLNFINQSSSTRGMVANNMLGGGFRFGQAMAMQVNYASYLDLYYNSVNLDFGTGYALFVSNAASTDLRVVNNSFAYTGTSTGRAMHANGANANFLVLNYNNYYSTGQFVWFNGMLRNDLAALQASMEYGTVAHDMNSWAVNPMYVSATDLHIDAASLLRNKAVELSSVITDYDGNVRSNPATIGADEYTAPNPRQSDSVAGIVYPNPFRAEVSVQLESGEGAVAVELIDMMGRRVYSTTASMANGTVRVQPQVAEGVYMLQLTKDGITTQYRVVKQ